MHPVLDYVTSPGIIIPTLVLLVLYIWQLNGTTVMLRESIEDLKWQLHHERTEGRRKLMADKRGPAGETRLSNRWKQILPSITTASNSKVRYFYIDKKKKSNHTLAKPFGLMTLSHHLSCLLSSTILFQCLWMGQPPPALCRC